MWSSDSRQWSNSSGYQGSRDWSNNKSKQSWQASPHDWWASKPVLPAHFKSDDKFFDSTAVGSGNHQFHRVIQSTDWSRKAQLAGRSVEDLRVHELCFRGMNEFSLRMLSEGRFQSIVWTRNTAESVLVTHLLKSIREMKADVDAVALECIKEQGLPVPDKHKQAASFMEPLVDVLLKEIKSRVPAAAASSSADFEELIRAKAKLAQAGLALTPRKPAAPSQASESPSKPGKSQGLPIDNQRGTKRKAEEQDPSSQVRKLLSGKPVTSLKDNRRKSFSNEHVESWMQTSKQQYKGKFRELNKHVNFVVKLLSENADRNEILEAAIKFGLDRKFAARLNISSLSKCIAVAKYQAA